MTTTDLDRTERARRRVALMVHECGHAIIAALHGATITEVTINDDEESGNTQISEPLGDDATAAVALAGPIAEASFSYGPRPSIPEIRSMLDGQCTADNTGDYDYLLASGQPLPLHVVKLVDTCMPAIHTLVMHMINNGGKADHQAVCAALNIPEEGGHLSAAASQIRAGFAPTPA